MNESFQVELLINNQPRVFEAEFQPSAYTYRIMVLIEGYEIIFEPDEERNFRALSSKNSIEWSTALRETVRAVGESLTSTFRD